MNHPASATPSDEIDVRALAQALWASKLLIAVITLAVTCTAAAYAFLSTPVYEAEVRLLPPTAGNLANYNMATRYTEPAIKKKPLNTQNTSLKPDDHETHELSPQEVYDTFLLRLTSNTVRRQFFDTVYFPAQSAALDPSSYQTLWKRLDKELTISVPAKPNETLTTLVLQGPNAQTTADWANAYVQLALSDARQTLLDDLASRVGASTQDLQNQISALRAVALIARNEQLARLQSALNIAKAIGLESPAPGSPLISISSSSANGNHAVLNSNMMYLRGAKALQAEINVLNARTNDDAYISGLPDLLKDEVLLKQANLNPKEFSVATVDRAATLPDLPVKPNKPLILILALILGGMLGVGIAVIRYLFKKPQ